MEHGRTRRAVSLPLSHSSRHDPGFPPHLHRISRSGLHINNLPRELLYHTFALLALNYWRDYDAVDDKPLRDEFPPLEREMKRNLRSMALVCKAWTAPAQALLWRRLSLRTEDDAKACLQSPAFATYCTTNLMLKGNFPKRSGDGVESLTAAEVIMGLAKNLTTLELCHFESFEFTSVRPHLKALQNLTFNLVTIAHQFLLDFSLEDGMRYLENAPTHFSLKRLIVIHGSLGSLIERDLFESSLGTLQHLEFSPGIVTKYNPKVLPAHMVHLANIFVHYFPRLAPGLTTLHLPETLAEDVIPHFALCENLADFFIADGCKHLARIIRLFPRPLKCLGVGRPVNWPEDKEKLWVKEGIDAILEIVDEPKAQQLSVLRLPYHDSNDFYDQLFEPILPHNKLRKFVLNDDSTFKKEVLLDGFFFK